MMRDKSHFNTIITPSIITESSDDVHLMLSDGMPSESTLRPYKGFHGVTFNALIYSEPKPHGVTAVGSR